MVDNKDCSEDSKFSCYLPLWSLLAPLGAWIVFVGAFLGFSGLFQIIMAIGLFSGVLAAVHHAEVVAHRVGEPYGTLVLALAVTLIEVALIVSLMVSGGPEAVTLARDTVFAAVMIILNGIVGICLLLGGIRHKEQTFQIDGVSTALVTLAAITVLTLILPNYTVTVPGPAYSLSQLVFIAIVSLVLYGTFVLIQTVRHRGYFLMEDADEKDDGLHDSRPGIKTTTTSALLLLISLVAVVLLAKKLSPGIESVILQAGAPKELVGIVIATVVLLPEGLAAVQATRRNHLQTSLNLALGSALASIGLTIPAVALVSLFSGLPLTLGVDIKSTILLLLSLFIAAISLRTGRTTILQGVVLLVLFAVYLFTTVVP